MEPETAVNGPDSPIRTTGTDHITVVGSNVADTVAFYRNLLGMRLVSKQPNLDQPDGTAEESLGRDLNPGSRPYQDVDTFRGLKTVI